MLHRLILVLALLIATPVAADEAEEKKQFNLQLDKISLRPQNPRTRARLDRWNNDPMARVEMAMATDQARMLGGYMPGIAQPRALALSIRLRKGLAAALVASYSASGVDFYEQPVTVIRWPWEDEDDAKPAMPMDEQLTIMLGNRLEHQE